ncbi:MAG: SUMF1/EgtB/PvdO family nonheme iron enzyme, partial [Lentisphaeria bacterium]|nr:SUMF1/EgtB/PvdO family nonheme iron enzyme [Lentisphaeria bacterium]
MATFLKSGETFSGCEIISRCGKGAVGIAYLAKNPLGQKIVIKIVSSPNNSDRELRGLQHYMKISNSHPNLLHIFHVGATPEGFYYTMEAADDCSSNCEYTPATLGNLLKRYKCFTPEEAIIITRELLEALKIIHQADLIHRDIKPENIIFVNGRAKLSDPGLVVKVGETVSLAGTLGFISPEVMNGAREFDQQCDLYALGKVFYCMVTGFSPAQYPQLPADMRLEVCRQINPVLLKMCNKNPEKRFKSAEEFLSGLPLKLEKPKKWEKILQDFKDYRQCNRGVFNAIFAAMLISLLLLLCCTTAWGIWQKKQHEQSKNWKKIADSFLAINKDRRELTGFQLKHYQPSIYGRYRDLSTSLEKAFQKKQWQTCAKLAIELQQLLEKTAADSMPPFPAGNVSFDRSWQISGAAHSFLATPLAAYADKKKLSAFRKKLAAHDTKLYRNWNGPKCGSEWLNEQFSFYPLIFVPQGAVRLRYLGKTVKLPYHFWICKHETLHASVSQLLGIAPQRSNLSGTPVERISWNDILFFCYILTVNFREHGILPPGYIVRPPTEAEWELAAANAWSGADTTPFSERARFGKNSEKRSWAPGSRKSSKLGLWDMYGNVAEMVIPHTKPRMHNSNIILGGSFLSSNEKACLKRTPCLAYQYIPGSIGFRIAVAPGSMKFFDSHFFLSGPQQTRYDGKVYELVGSISGSFDWI